MRTFISLLVLCACLRGVSIVSHSALSDDEAIYAVVAREMLAGRVLYRDVVDHKPPMIYFTYAVSQAVGGPRGGMIVVHVLTVLAVFGTGLVLRRLMRRHAAVDDATATAAAVLWIVFSTTMIDFDSLAANCELFMVLPLAMSVDCYLRGRFAAAGALVAIGMLFKYQAAIHLPLFALHLAWTSRRDIRRVLLGWLLLGGSAAAVVAAVVGILVAAGAGPSAWFWLKFNFAYIQSGMAPLEVIERAAVRISIVVGGALLLYILGLRGAWRAVRQNGQEASPLFRFAVAWLAVSAVAVAVGGRFYGHYFHQLTPVLAVLGAPGAIGLMRSHRRVAAIATALPAAGFFFAGAFHQDVMRLIGQPDPDYPAMAAVIRDQAGPGGSMCVWGNVPVLYFEANLPLGCRFVFANYLSGMSPATDTQYDPAADASMNIVPEAWSMLEADFATRKPTIVVDASYGDVANYGKFPIAKFPRLVALLRDYKPSTIVDGLRVFRRNTASSAGANSSAVPRQVASPMIDAVPNDRIP